jgi:hypothetical protein
MNLPNCLTSRYQQLVAGRSGFDYGGLLGEFGGTKNSLFTIKRIKCLGKKVQILKGKLKGNQ